MNQLEINKDITAIKKTIKDYGDYCQAIGYSHYSYLDVLDHVNNATNDDDKEAYSNSAERLAETISRLNQEKDDAEQKIADSFAHYYE